MVWKEMIRQARNTMISVRAKAMHPAIDEAGKCLARVIRDPLAAIEIRHCHLCHRHDCRNVVANKILSLAYCMQKYAKAAQVVMSERGRSDMPILGGMLAQLFGGDAYEAHDWVINALRDLRETIASESAMDPIPGVHEVTLFHPRVGRVTKMPSRAFVEARFGGYRVIGLSYIVAKKLQREGYLVQVDSGRDH